MTPGTKGTKAAERDHREGRRPAGRRGSHQQGEHRGDSGESWKGSNLNTTPTQHNTTPTKSRVFYRPTHPSTPPPLCSATILNLTQPNTTQHNTTQHNTTQGGTGQDRMEQRVYSETYTVYISKWSFVNKVKGGYFLLVFDRDHHPLFLFRHFFTPICTADIVAPLRGPRDKGERVKRDLNKHTSRRFRPSIGYVQVTGTNYVEGRW